MLGGHDHEHRTFHAEALQLALDLDDAAVAGAVAARHRRLPGELRAGAERADRLQHRLGAAREHVVSRRDQLGHEHRVDRHLGAGQQHGGFGVALAAEAEHDGREAQRLREIRKRRHPDPPADEERPLHVEPVAVAERAEDVDPVAGFEHAERLRARADRIDEERELAGRREAERECPRQEPAGRLEHEELARHSGVDPAPLEPQQRVRPDRLDRANATPFASQHRSAPGARRPARRGRSRLRAPRPRPRPSS